MPHQTIDYSALSTTERIHLAQELWESVHDDAKALPLSAEQKAEIERRHAGLESGAVQGIPWEEVKQTLLQRR